VPRKRKEPAVADQNPPQKQAPSPEGGPTPRGALPLRAAV
jgi:hypothetical protein